MIEEVSILDTRLRRANGTEFLHSHIRSVRQNDHKRPYLVFSHGFSVDGLESHRMFMNFARIANQRGYSCVLFDHYGIGYSDGVYADFRLSRAAEDLISIARQARGQLDSDGRCVLVGQSLGTAVAALAEKGLRRELLGSVLWNLSANIADRYPKLFGEGILEKDNHCLPEKGLLIGKSFMEDARNCDILGSFESFSTPVLFLTCGDDEKSDSELAKVAASKVANLGDRTSIPGANHSFKCQPELEKIAISRSLAWIERLKP